MDVLVFIRTAVSHNAAIMLYQSLLTESLTQINKSAVRPWALALSPRNKIPVDKTRGLITRPTYFHFYLT